jgi:hypothetical protein
VPASEDESSGILKMTAAPYVSKIAARSLQGCYTALFLKDAIMQQAKEIF